MSHDSVEEILKAQRRYLLVFAALAAGTILTVLVSYVDFGHSSINIGVALAIALVKGSLVAGYFMHLISEKKLIYGILVATIFFFTGLMYLTVWSMEPDSLIHIKRHVT